jgi:hypothetical protein
VYLNYTHFSNIAIKIGSNPSPAPWSEALLQEPTLTPHNYWVFGLFPSPGILVTRKHDVSETGSVSVLR